MTNNDILKVIDLLNKNENEKAKEILKTQLVKATDKSGYNILTLAKKILNGADKYRPILKTIQHNANGEQFVCDGFVGLKWKKKEQALDSLPQTESGNSLDIDAIFGKYQNYTLTDNDKFIIKNIDNFVDLIMAEKIDKKEKGCVVNIFGKYFDLNVIKNAIKIGLAYDNDFTNTQFFGDEKTHTPIQFENKNIKAIISPVRVIDDEEKAKFNERTQKLIDTIRGL